MLKTSLQFAAHSAVMAAVSDPTLWYITRAAAVCAYVLLTLVVGLGIMRSLARQLSTRSSWLVNEMHQFLALLAGAFIVLHLGSLLLDPFLSFSLTNMLLPFAQPYRTLGTDIGVLAMYTLTAILVSSWMRNRLSIRVWHGIHLFSYGAFALVTAHGLIAGTDASQPWMSAIYIGATVFVISLTLVRLFTTPQQAPADSSSLRQ